MSALLFGVLMFGASQAPQPGTGEDRTESQVLACAGLDDEDRALAMDLAQVIRKLQHERLALETERLSLEQAMQDLILLSDSTEPVRPVAGGGTETLAGSSAATTGPQAGSPDDTQAAEDQELPRDPRKLVRVVERMKPAAAALVVQRLDQVLAEGVLRGMKPAAAAKLLAALPPDRAARLARAIAKEPQDLDHAAGASPQFPETSAPASAGGRGAP
ncbi:MAG: hypothetical protein ABIJ09_18010 [Pseudomonadota bacterium]